MGRTRTRGTRDVVGRLVGVHRVVWSICAAAVATVGLLLALFGTAVGMLLVVLVSFSACSAVIAYAVAAEFPHAVRPAIIAGPVVAVLLFVIDGLDRWIGPWGLLLLALLALTSPEMVSLLLRRLGREPRADAPRRDRRALADPPAALDAETLPGQGLTITDALGEVDLCRAWCSSFVALQRAQSTQSRLRSVQVRALYLDELERRDAAALLQWLDSDPRPGSDPSRFFQASTGDPSIEP